MAKTGFKWDSRETKVGETTYYVTQEEGNRCAVHADNKCKHLKGETVYIKSSSQLSKSRDRCTNCTVPDPEYEWWGK